MRRSETWGIALRAACISALLILSAGYTLYHFDAIAGTLTLPKTWVDGEVITATKLNQNPVAIAAVINGGIDDANLTNAGITGSTKLKNLTVTLGKMAANSVDGSKIVSGSIAATHMASDAVNTGSLDDQACVAQFLWGNGGAGGVDNAAESFSRIMGEQNSLTPEASMPGHRVQVATWFQNMTVTVGTAPGAGNSWQVILRDDDVDTGIECTISDTATTCTDPAPGVLVAAGSEVHWRIIPTSTPAAATGGFYVSVCYNPD